MNEKQDSLIPRICPLAFNYYPKGLCYFCREISIIDDDKYYGCSSEAMHGADNFEMHEYKDKCEIFSQWFWRKVVEQTSVKKEVE